MGTSYGASLAEKVCRDIQKIIKESKYGELFPSVSLGGLKNSEGFEIAYSRGTYKAAGVGGGITGQGFTIGLCDDAFKDHEEAYSKTIRDKVYDWFKTTFYTRKAPLSGVIIIGTRWHHDDLCGRLLQEEPDKWKVIAFPAIAEDDDKYRKKGEALHPERYPIEQLLEFKTTLGSRFFEAMYQQHPSPVEGNMVNRGWLKFYKELPHQVDELVLSWDMAFKESKNSDYVVGQCWARVGAAFYLVDQIRDRMDFPTTLVSFKMLSNRYPRATIKLVEDKANGSAIIDTLKKEITGIIPITPKESKEARLAAVSPLFEAGNVYLPEHAIWCQDYIEELVSFPNGKNDDCVDSSSQALNYLKNNMGKFFGIMRR
jgi:predicted phage terminase large subunit-like protein